MSTNKVLSNEQLEMIDSIDEDLSCLMKKMEYEEYLNFLRGDEYLATYDDVLGYNDVNYLPDAFLSGLTMDFLGKVKNRVELKLKELD